ncbi:MAG TPA: polysaccharide biosynthesis/export family protein [Candidatus Acidoferrum sp.]|nr:polysaccharide biosynthesis/export family protein [Candidatus Acidoferrum sp.]
MGIKLPVFGQNLFQNVPSTFAPLDRVEVPADYIIGPGDEVLIRAWGQIDVDWRAVVDRAGAIYIPKIGTLSIAGVKYDDLHDYLQAHIGRIFKNFQLSVSMGRLRSIQVFVVGQVRRPGLYTISSLSSLVDALFASGGPSKRGSMRRIQLKRAGKIVTTFDLYDLIVNGDKTKDAKLMPGDVIYVPSVGPLVALAGSVNIPAVFELRKEGTALEEVIGYAGGLTNTAAGEHAVVERIGDHHIRQADEFPLNKEGLARELHDGDVVRFLRLSSKFENAVILRGNVAVPGRYPWHQSMHVKDLIPSRDFLITEEFWKRQNKLAIDPDGASFKLREELERERDREFQPGDKDTSPANQPGVQNQQTEQPPNSSQNRDRDMQSDRRSSTRGDNLAERVGRTEAQRIKQEELKNEVKRSGAEINWEYAVIQRMNPEDLTTHLLPFNLGKAIVGDEAQNLTLQPGDVITIFSQSDMQVPTGQQSKFVRLEGEFRSAGVYQAEPGESLRHVITRVGGLTPQAYLYGAEFTRESVREDQQRRLDQYVNELEKAIERNAGSQRNLSGEEVIAERQAAESQRRLLDKLRQLKATGRIVLELRPNANDLQAFPDLVLEDGDRLLVPFRPATVNVIGSVYNTNAFIYKQGKTFGDYLRVAGGATRNGDRGRSFIIRADGTTVSSQGHNGALLRSFNMVRLMPGDTIVVPERLDKGVTLRGFKDWTQIIGQFVIGAAAAKVLFP